MWAYLCTVKAFLAIFFGTYYLLGSLWADCWIMEMKKQNGTDLKTINFFCVGWQCVSVSTARQPFRQLTNSFRSISIILIYFSK
jgi:hypothetical protein